LDITTYDKLRQPYHDLILLVLFVLPEDIDQWINHSEEELISRKCAYWHSIQNCPKIDNQDTVTVKILREHTFSPEQLSDLINKVARKEAIPNGCN
jgi:hypothetical protein